MKRSIVMGCALFLGVAAAAQSPADSAAIRATALDYIDGWWAGDGDRMARALHPELAKRIQQRGPQGAFVRAMTASELVAGTHRGGGSDTPAAERRNEVRILDIFQHTASVRVDAGGWIDYMHMVRTPEGWRILNVLWEVRER